MKIRFLGAARTVTGSCFEVTTDSAHFLVDCGLFQGSKELKERNYGPLPVNPASLDFIILTHAHIDHCGLLPKYYANGFRGRVYCTVPTKKLASLLLPDSAHIQEMEVERKNRKLSRAGVPLLTPIYTVADAQNTLNLFQASEYGERVSPAPGMEIRFLDAGHILGSSVVEMWVSEKGQTIKLVFSGDVGNYNQPILCDPTRIEDADYLIMESTYGSRVRDQNKDKREQLLEIIEFTFSKGGNLVIPAFAVERTQDLLYDLSILYSEGRLPKGLDIYIDSPLAVAATRVFAESQAYYDQETRGLLAQGINPFELPNLKFSVTREESVRLNDLKGGAIILSASGMCDAGRIKHHLKHNLWRPESTILFVGYQAQGTLGRRILDGEKLVRIHGEEVAVRADIRQIDGYSAHADKTGLIKWVKSFARIPGHIILVHGEEEGLEALAASLSQDLGVDVLVPSWMDELEIKVQAEEVPEPIAEAVPGEARMPSVMALDAEEAYLQVQLLLNRMYKESLEKGTLEDFTRKLGRITELLRQVS